MVPTKEHGTLRVSFASDLPSALPGTDAVLVAAKPRGTIARGIDHARLLELGIPGHDAVGPGGFLSALRSVPHALAVAEAARELAPDALLLVCSEPVNIVTQALVDVGVERVIGLCAQPDHDMVALGRALGLDGAPRAYRAVGLHEATWYTDIDLGERPLARPPADLDAPTDLSETQRVRFRVAHQLAMKHEGVWPSSNLAFYARPDLLASVAHEEAAQSDDSHTATVECRREAELLVELLAGLNGSARRRFVLNVPNHTTTPQLGYGTVIQADVEVSETGVRRVSAPPLPAGEEPWFRQLENYQTKAASAARRVAEDAWVDALLANPLVNDTEVATALIGYAKEWYGQAAPLLGGTDHQRPMRARDPESRFE